MTQASKVKAMYDAASTAVLRNASDGAETSTATETAVALNILDAAYWQSGNKIVPHGVLEVTIHVTALDATTGDETYTLALLVDDASAMNDTPLAVWTQAITATGVYTALIDSDNIAKIIADKSGTDLWMAIRATLGGTTPSITYGAWISASRSP
jgi:hypothetical protein